MDARIAEMFFSLANEAMDCIDPGTCPRASVDFRRIAERAAAYGYQFYSGERPAPGIEAAPADTTRSGMAGGESPVAESETPNHPSPQMGSP